MYHQHFNTLGSTQIYLNEHLEELLHYGDKNILVSCCYQTDGIGRKGNSWESFPNSLAMSFTLTPQSQVATLTPLEIAVIIVEFLAQKFGVQLLLKWPNDLLTPDGKKCGGIICQFINNQTIIAGVGLNLGKFDIPERSFRHGLSVVTNQDFSEDEIKQLSEELYHRILNGRIGQALDVRQKFLHYCFHYNRLVSIVDHDQEYVGRFVGIGDIGQALISIDFNVQKFISGILTVLNE